MPGARSVLVLQAAAESPRCRVIEAATRTPHSREGRPRSTVEPLGLLQPFECDPPLMGREGRTRPLAAPAATST